MAHHPDRCLAPIEIRPHARATLAAGSAHKPRFDIGQSDIIRPVVAADRDRVATSVVGAIDDQPAHTALAHLGERDLFGGRSMVIPLGGWEGSAAAESLTFTIG